MADGPSAAPTTPASPATQPTPNGQAAKPDPKAAWKDFTSKAGPLAVTVNKKAVTYDDFDAVKRDLSSAAAYRQQVDELRPKAQQAEAERQMVEQLKAGGDPDKVWEHIERTFGETALKAAEKRFMKLIAADNEAKALSPEARAYKERAEKAEAEAQKAAQAARELEQRQQQARFQQEAQSIAQELEGIVVTAFEGLKAEGLEIGADFVPYFMPLVAADLDHAKENGLEVDPAMVAASTAKIYRNASANFLRSLSPGAALDMLKSIVLKNPDGKPFGNLATAIMQEHVRRKNGGAQPQQGVTPPAPAETAPTRRRGAANETLKTLQGFLRSTQPPLVRSGR